MIRGFIGWLLSKEVPPQPAPPRATTHRPEDYIGYLTPEQRKSGAMCVQDAHVRARDMQFGIELRKTTEGLCSEFQWMERVLKLEQKFGKRTPDSLFLSAREDALVSVREYRASINAQVQRHNNRPSRIFRTARQWSLA